MSIITLDIGITVNLITSLLKYSLSLSARPRHSSALQPSASTVWTERRKGAAHNGLSDASAQAHAQTSDVFGAYLCNKVYLSLETYIHVF